MTNGKFIKRVCFFCGETFYAQNPTAKYHTAYCRLKAFRWRNRTKTLANEILRDLGELEEYLEFADSRDRAAALIAHLANCFDKALKAGNIRRVK